MSEQLKSPSDSNVMVLSVVRNCEHSLKSEVLRIKKALNCFKKVSFHIVESDSQDNTVRCLEDLAADHKHFSFVSMGELSEMIPNRINRICYCRNTSLKKLESYENIDFVVIADLDGINSKISVDAVLSCWENNIKWDVCTANQSTIYYDVYALRHESWNNSDCWEAKKRLRTQFSPLNSKILAVNSKMIHINKNGPLIEVTSAFGGFAIYRREVLEGCSYDSLDSNGNVVCEHVMFHESIINQGFKIYINPALINGGWNEHSRHMKFHYFSNYTKLGRLSVRLFSALWVFDR